MRGRVIPLFFFSLFFSILFSATAYPQCSFEQSHSAALRSTYFDAAVAGNELWAATGYGVQVLDRSIAPPRILSLTAVPGVTRTIDVRDGVAYAGSGTSVYVLRRNGTRLEIVRSVDAGALVNDVAATSMSLFVATANGLLAFDRHDPLQPSSPITLPTSSSNVLSLARNGESQLLAADGDSTVERFATAGTPAPSGALSALQRSLAVSVAGGRIFVSDGQQTQVFTGTGTATVTIPYGGTTVAAHSAEVFYLAGSDRRFRAVDLTLAGQPVELYAADIFPSGGTVNRIGALVEADGRLYVAGGDAGITTLDTTAFTAPYPLRSHAFGMKTSVVEGAPAVYVGNATGGLTELSRHSSGGLAAGRTWGESQVHLVHALDTDLLLTSSGSTLTYWTVRSGVTPTAISTANMAAPVRQAVLMGTVAIVLLEDRTYWSVDLSREQPSPVMLGSETDRIASSDHGFARISITADGATEIRLYEGGVTTGPQPQAVTVAGAATAAAMNGSRVAIFTFRGITVVDFSGPAPVQTLLPQSATSIVRDLELRGARLIDVSSNALRVWDLDQQRVIRTFALAAEGHAVSAHPSSPAATVLTSDGVVTIHYEAAGRQPERLATVGGNQYATKLVTSASRMFVFDGSTISIYSMAGAAPRLAGSVSAAGALDLAATENALFVLFSNGAVVSHSHSGATLRSTKIDEGPDAVPVAIFAAGGAPWVSITRGCLSTGCEEKTLVLDPVSLVRTTTLDGGTQDLVVAGNVAYARVDLPPQKLIRAYQITQPLAPSLTASQPLDSSVAAIAHHPSGVLALGTRLFTHALPSLQLSGESLPPMAVSSATDLAVEAGCAVITGRSAGAELYQGSGSQWSSARTLPLPGTARRISAQPGRIVILTDYSIEIWTREPAPAPPRRRP